MIFLSADKSAFHSVWSIVLSADKYLAIALVRSSAIGHSLKSYIHSHHEGYVNPMSVGCAYKREVIEKIGLFDEAFDACEDVEYNYRVKEAGFKTYFCSQIAVYYYARENLKGLFFQLIRYGKGRCNLMFKHPKTISIETLLPAIFVSFLIMGTIASFFNTLFLQFSIIFF